MKALNDHPRLMVSLEETIGYRFTEPELLRRALTHPSFAHEQPTPVSSYERLEFLGDAVLEIVVTTFLYHRFPTADEGELSQRRNRLVRRTELARAAKGWDLGEYLRLGRGERTTGGAQKPRILEDAFEAVVGAIYLDSGLAECERILNPWLLEATVRVSAQGETDHKTALQHRLQAESGRLPTYQVLSRTVSSNPRFTELCSGTSPRISASSMRALASPTAARGVRTVVSGGSIFD